MMEHFNTMQLRIANVQDAHGSCLKLDVSMNSFWGGHYADIQDFKTHLLFQQRVQAPVLLL